MDAILVALLIGLAVGVVVGALGAGGGILSVPILVYALGQAPHSASASSLVIVGSTALAGLAHHIRRETVDWRTGLTFGLLGVAGSFLGSRLSVRVDGRVLMGLFAVMLAMVAVAMFRQAFITRRIERRRSGEPVANALRRRPGEKGKWVPVSALPSPRRPPLPNRSLRSLREGTPWLDSSLQSPFAAARAAATISRTGTPWLRASAAQSSSSGFRIGGPKGPSLIFTRTVP